MTRALTLHRQPAQRGAATLVIVMVLFLIMALLAAYANRSMMFEQRVSGSYYRASIAQEMAEGGIDWTVAMMNGPGIDANCQPLAGGQRFVNRYFNVSSADRKSPAIGTPGAIVVDCASTPTGLVCRCPSPTATRVNQPSTAASSVLVPSVGLALGASPTATTYYGSVTLTSVSCTGSSVDECAGNNGAEIASQKAYGRAVQMSQLAFIAAVPSFPSSPLTVKGALTTTGSGGLGLHNTDPRSTGILAVSGGDQPADLKPERMDTLPGTPMTQALIFRDTTLDKPDNEYERNKVFLAFLGMAPSRYKNHPALRTVTCSSGDCSADLTAAYNAGQRLLWIDGNMILGADFILGSASDPVMLVVNGDVTLSGPMQLTGMLVAQGAMTWTNSVGTSKITGSLLVTKTLATDGRMDIVYLSSVGDQLRNRLGSYARVQGSWIDSDLR